MVEHLKLKAGNPEIMAQIGHSLTRSLYATQTDILLQGELGSGKTTLMQGIAKGLGISASVTSPTYALEQRYDGKKPLLHLDLFRLEPKEARTLVVQSEEFDGIRCIEWSERLEGYASSRATMMVTIEEKESHREVSITLDDIPLPSSEKIKEWRRGVLLPSPICDHCDAVGALARTFAQTLIAQGYVARPSVAACAGQLHDLLRFIDFRPGAAHVQVTHSEEEEQVWKEWKERFPGLHHEQACAQFLQKQGYDALATVVETHGVELSPCIDATTEQLLVYYADKRMLVDRIVTLEERFEDFSRRYTGGQRTPNGERWYREAKVIEHLLFPQGIPSMD